MVFEDFVVKEAFIKLILCENFHHKNNEIASSIILFKETIVRCKQTTNNKQRMNKQLPVYRASPHFLLDLLDF